MTAPLPRKDFEWLSTFWERRLPAALMSRNAILRRFGTRRWVMRHHGGNAFGFEGSGQLRRALDQC